MNEYNDEEKTKNEIVNFVKNCEMCYMYDIFDVCRERHNNQMSKRAK